MKRRKPQFYRLACRNCGQQAGMTSPDGGELTSEILLRLTKTLLHGPSCPDPRAPPFIDKAPPWLGKVVVVPNESDGSYDLPPRTVPLHEEQKLVVESPEGLRLGVIEETEGLHVQWFMRGEVRFWGARKTA